MDLSIPSIGVSLRQNSAPKGPGGPPSHENAINQFSKNLTEEQRTSILKTISELQESEASFDEVKATVETSGRKWYRTSKQRRNIYRYNNVSPSSIILCA